MTQTLDIRLRTGDIVAGKYRVESVLGSGGMGVVIAATHIELGKRVALKMMRGNDVLVASSVERFKREARAAVQLRSEHAAQMLDVGELPDGTPYLVMELLEGGDVANALTERGALPIDEAVDVVLQACEAVAEAHMLGIVHRDLKPNNLFLAHHVDGSMLVKVLDFGISKWTPKNGEEHSLTRTNDVMGSPNYMSPEQIRSSKDVDARTDIWSLGVILYELLAGRVPFLAESVPQLCSRVLEEEPLPLDRLRSDVPPGLASVIARCLEKLPERRYPSVQALVEALAPFAPARSHLSIVRVRGIGSRPPAKSPLALSSGAQIHVSNGTSVSWADTVRARARRTRIAAWIGGVVLAACGLATGFVLFLQSRERLPHAISIDGSPGAPGASGLSTVSSAPLSIVQPPSSATGAAAATDPILGSSSSAATQLLPVAPASTAKPLEGGQTSAAAKSPSAAARPNGTSPGRPSPSPPAAGATTQTPTSSQPPTASAADGGATIPPKAMEDPLTPGDRK